MIDLFKPRPIAWQPKAYQKRAIKWLIERPSALLWLDPGLGKTSISLAAIKLLKSRRLLTGPVLIVGQPKVINEVWPVEAEKWKDFHDLTIRVLHGPDKEVELRRPADIYCVSYEGLAWLLGAAERTTPTGKKVWAVNKERWAKLGFQLVVFDEITKLKNHDSKRFKLIKDVLPSFKWRWGLTGTPASNGLLGLFSQVYSVDVGKTFGPYVTKFRREYFLPDDSGFDFKLQDDGAERIYAAVSPLALSMSASEYLDLPPISYVDIRVTLPPRVRKIYDNMERVFIAELESGMITAPNSAVASARCRQLASGGAYSDAVNEKTGELERVTHHVHDIKTDALEDLIDELNGQQLLIAYQWKHDLARIKARLGDKLHVIGGGTTAETRRTIELWNSGSVTNLAGHPGAIGHGLNLQGSGCGHVCWYSPTWDLEHYEQLNRRVWRQGTTANRVIVYHIVAHDTLDDAVLSAIQGKHGSQQALFDAVRAYAKKKKKR